MTPSTIAPPKAAIKAAPRSETVMLGHDYGGKINSNDRGHEAFGPDDKYLATFPTIAAARKALFELHRDRAMGLADAQ